VSQEFSTHLFLLSLLHKPYIKSGLHKSGTEQGKINFPRRKHALAGGLRMWEKPDVAFCSLKAHTAQYTYKGL